MNALIGHTGFIGGVLKKSIPNCDLYNTINIESIKGKKYDTIYCCGISGIRWLANKNPKEDLENIISLVEHLKGVKCNKLILISTIAIYDDEPYGFNRKLAEKMISELFPNTSVYRLPSIYGEGLKKNILFDMLNDSLRVPINTTHPMQWYNIDNLHIDILEKSTQGIHELYPEPITHGELVELFDKRFDSICDESVKGYRIVKPIDGYLYTASEVKKQLKKYIDDYS